MHAATSRTVVLPGNRDGRSIEKKVDEVFFSFFLDFAEAMSSGDQNDQDLAAEDVTV